MSRDTLEDDFYCFFLSRANLEKHEKCSKFLCFHRKLLLFSCHFHGFAVHLDCFFMFLFFGIFSIIFLFSFEHGVPSLWECPPSLEGLEKVFCHALCAFRSILFRDGIEDFLVFVHCLHWCLFAGLRRLFPVRSNIFCAPSITDWLSISSKLMASFPINAELKKYTMSTQSTRKWKFLHILHFLFTVNYIS